MKFTSFFNTEIYTWIILPLFIFIARILDVSLGTIRVIFISRGFKYLAPLISFFEILIWLFAIKQIMQNLNDFLCYIAYAGGFASGTFIGMYIENKLSLGNVLIRIVTKKEADELVEFLKSADYGVTSFDAYGIEGKVKVIYAIVERQDIKDIVDIIKRFNPNALYSIEDVRFVSEKIKSLRKNKNEYMRLIRLRRKGK